MGGPQKLPRGPNGRGLCRWCSLEVPPRRFTFCSDFCVHEWKLRSQPGYLREQILKRDRGVCAHCGLHTIEEQSRLKRARGAARQALMRHWGFNTRIRKSLWDADHILPVAEGGGECDLDNIRTLVPALSSIGDDAASRANPPREGSRHARGGALVKRPAQIFC
jgi:5-methylcytosine-specific restriction protein A